MLQRVLWIDGLLGRGYCFPFGVIWMLSSSFLKWTVLQWFFFARHMTWVKDMILIMMISPEGQDFKT